jgi:hypothetical protein
LYLRSDLTDKEWERARSFALNSRSNDEALECFDLIRTREREVTEKGDGEGLDKNYVRDAESKRIVYAQIDLNLGHRECFADAGSWTVKADVNQSFQRPNQGIFTLRQKQRSLGVDICPPVSGSATVQAGKLQHLSPKLLDLVG